MTHQDLLYEQSDGVAVITFNRPDRLNSFRRATVRALQERLAACAADAALYAVVLTGAGRAFCAGEEHAHQDEPLADSLEAARAGAQVLQDLARLIAGAPQVYIAALNGVAAGFGAELAVACDLRIGASDLHMMFPAIRRGLFFTSGITYLLPRLVGSGRAAELLLTGRRIAAEEAFQIGLLNRLAPMGQAREHALELARGLVASSPQALRLAKLALRQAADLDTALLLEVDGRLADAGAS